MARQVVVAHAKIRINIPAHCRTVDDPNGNVTAAFEGNAVDAVKSYRIRKPCYFFDAVAICR